MTAAGVLVVAVTGSFDDANDVDRTGLYVYGTDGILRRLLDTDTTLPASTGSLHPYWFTDAAIDEDGVTYAFESLNYHQANYVGPSSILLNDGISLRTIALANGVGGTATVIPDSGGDTFKKFGSSISIDNGVVSFIGYGNQSGGFGVYSGQLKFGDTAVLHTIANRNTPIPGGVGTFTDVEVLAQGPKLFAFTGFGTGGQKGIYAEASGTLRKIIDRNTVIDGKTPANFSLNGNAIDGNQIVFGVTFTDGIERDLHRHPFARELPNGYGRRGRRSDRRQLRHSALSRRNPRHRLRRRGQGRCQRIL